MSSTEGLSDASSDDAGVSTREDFSLGGAGEEEEGADEGGSCEDDEAVAVAQPPRSLSRPSEQELTITGSAALDELDQVSAAGASGGKPQSNPRCQHAGYMHD